MALATRIPGAKFLGRDSHGGICGRCTRDLAGNTYLIDLGSEDVVVMGRRCAARTMGWATSRVEMMAIQAERMAELTRRRAIIGAEFPTLAEATARCDDLNLFSESIEAYRQMHALRAVFYEASNADYFWDESHPAYGKYGTWQEYAAAHLVAA